jgi:LmbE family N-acetylglucosaminyl deacetylase
VHAEPDLILQYLISNEHDLHDDIMFFDTKTPEFLDLSPNEIIFSRRFVTIIYGIIRKYEPEAIFSQWIVDSRRDHQAVTKAVKAAPRDLNDLFMYETTIPGGLTEKVQPLIDLLDFDSILYNDKLT